MFKLLVLSLILTGNALAYSIKTGAKGPLVGGYKTLDVEDEKVRPILYDIATFSVDKIAEQRMAEQIAQGVQFNQTAKPLKYSLIRVVAAKSQVVAGVNYQLTIRMKDADCQRACPVEICDLVVYDKPWEKIRNVTNVNCKKRKVILGGLNEIPSDNEAALEALEYGLKKINEQSNDLYLQKLVKVDKIYRQIVSGYKYVYEVSLGKSNCMKNTQVENLEVCPVDEKNVKKTKIEIWDQPWLETSRYKLMGFNFA
jgi:hypothetical protein